MPTNPPTESARRAADKIIANLNDRAGLHISDLIDNVQAEIKDDFVKAIDESCHLPEIKEALKEATEALAIMNGLSERDPQLKYIVLNHPAKPQKCVGDVLKSALAAIEKVKL